MMKLSKKNLVNVLIAVCVAVFAYCMYRLISQEAEYRASRAVYTALGEMAADVRSPSLTTGGGAEGESSQSGISPLVNFDELRAINPDVVAWIFAPDTEIHYPVVQGIDNSFYLNHLFDGSVNMAGALFLDSLNASEFSDQNSIIYGHYMNDGTMFTSLKEYKTQSYFDEHPTMLLLTPDANYQIDIFAGYVAAVTDAAWKRGFESADEFEKWIAERIRRSAFQSGLTPSADDRIITLSTCSYEFENARFVLLGVLTQFP